MATQALAISDTLTTGSRSAAAVPRDLTAPVSGGSRFVRTRKGLALFDEAGRFIGTVEAPRVREPCFGPGAETLLLRRS